MFAVVTRAPGLTWRLLAGPFTSVREAHNVALRILRDTPPGMAILATCPWDIALDEHRNVDGAREAGAIERVTG